MYSFHLWVVKSVHLSPETHTVSTSALHNAEITQATYLSVMGQPDGGLPPYAPMRPGDAPKKSPLDRILARFGFRRGASPGQTTDESPNAKLPKTRSPKTPSQGRVLKECGRCGEVFYHPIRSLDPTHLRYCGWHHPGTVNYLTMSL